MILEQLDFIKKTHQIQSFIDNTSNKVIKFLKTAKNDCEAHRLYSGIGGDSIQKIICYAITGLYVFLKGSDPDEIQNLDSA